MAFSTFYVSVLVFLCSFSVSWCAVITFDQKDFLDRPSKVKKEDRGSQQSWNYLTVRDKAHMFWWLYESEAAQGWEKVPLILWLQGGPGASGTGFGNFEEIGPLNVKLEKRNTTWLHYASLLFVDNPVGAGYSYAEDKSVFCRDIDCIAQDLLTLIEHLFVTDLKKYQKVPFYIFSESYGGKMAAVFSKYLYKAVKEKGVPINFKGVALGDSWIAPVFYVQSWAPYLYTTSLIGKQGFEDIGEAANHVNVAANQGQWSKATELWNEAENVVETRTHKVNFYNILKWNADDSLIASDIAQQPVRSLFERKMGAFAQHGLTALMNGFIRHKLQIIPDNVTWGGSVSPRMNVEQLIALKFCVNSVATYYGQMEDVFVAQVEEFMKPVIDTVDYLLTNTDLQVVVYNGQLDLICDTLGTEGWVQTLMWPDLPNFQKAERTAIVDKAGVPRMFARKYKNFSFYWVLEAGHMIPQDQGESSVMLLQDIVGA